MRWFLAFALLGCASGGDDPQTTSTDASPDTRVATDGAPIDTYLPPGDGTIFPTEDTSLPKVCDTPVGTTASASGEYMSSAGDSCDHNLGTIWNSGGYTGTMTLKFPKAIKFDRVRIAAMSLPDCEETYSITAGGTKIGGATRALNGSTRWLDPIDVTPGTYDEITIDIAMAASWITLAEVQVFDSTGGCMAP